jgi:hypothetical protein
MVVIDEQKQINRVSGSISSVRQLPHKIPLVVDMAMAEDSTGSTFKVALVQFQPRVSRPQSTNHIETNYPCFVPNFRN